MKMKKRWATILNYPDSYKGHSAASEDQVATFRALEANDEFQEDVARIRKEFKIKEGKSPIKKSNAWLPTEAIISLEASKLEAKFKLPEGWFITIYSYILNGDRLCVSPRYTTISTCLLSDPSTNAVLDLGEDVRDRDEMLLLVIKRRLESKTELIDYIDRNWAELKKMMEALPRVRRNTKHKVSLEDAEKIMDLRKKGLKYKEIAKEVKREEETVRRIKSRYSKPKPFQAKRDNS